MPEPDVLVSGAAESRVSRGWPRGRWLALGALGAIAALTGGLAATAGSSGHPAGRPPPPVTVGSLRPVSVSALGVVRFPVLVHDSGGGPAVVHTLSADVAGFTFLAVTAASGRPVHLPATIGTQENLPVTLVLATRDCARALGSVPQIVAGVSAPGGPVRVERAVPTFLAAPGMWLAGALGCRLPPIPASAVSPPLGTGDPPGTTSSAEVRAHRPLAVEVDCLGRGALGVQVQTAHGPLRATLACGPATRSPVRFALPAAPGRATLAARTLGRIKWWAVLVPQG